MKLLALLHENARLRQERDEARARADELYERLRTLDRAFTVYRGKNG